MMRLSTAVRRNEWSVAEIINHLYLVEERVIKDLEKALAREPRKLGLMRRLVPTSIVASRLIRVMKILPLTSRCVVLRSRVTT